MITKAIKILELLCFIAFGASISKAPFKLRVSLRNYKLQNRRSTALHESADYLDSIGNIIRKINGVQISESIFQSSSSPSSSSNIDGAIPMFEKVVQNIITSTSSAPQDPLPIILEPNNNFLSQLGYLASEIAANPITIPLFTAITTAFVIAGVGYDDSKVGNPYDGLVAPRMLRLVFLTAAFNWNLLIDWRTGNLAKNEKIRAKEALELCTKLGPTFIKLGQALSIRTDLLNEAYANELQ
eukprot:gene36565-49269_t